MSNSPKPGNRKTAPAVSLAHQARPPAVFQRQLERVDRVGVECEEAPRLALGLLARLVAPDLDQPHVEAHGQGGLAKTQSSENPVYYVQYAHARIASILRTADERGIKYESADLSLLTHKRELELIRKIIELPGTVERAAERMEPHHLPHFAMDLARSLQRFYEDCRVVSSEASDLEISRARLHLVEAAKLALSRTLTLMGMSSPERM